MRILLVEDHPAVLTTLADVLRDGGHEVGAAATFEAANSLLIAPSDWDALITDVLLPGGGDGLGLASKAEWLGIPCLIVTGHPDQMIALSATGLRYLTKPFSVNLLLGWLTRLDRQVGRSDVAASRDKL